MATCPNPTSEVIEVSQQTFLALSFVFVGCTFSQMSAVGHVCIYLTFGKSVQTPQDTITKKFEASLQQNQPDSRAFHRHVLKKQEVFLLTCFADWFFQKTLFQKSSFCSNILTIFAHVSRETMCLIFFLNLLNNSCNFLTAN